MKQFISNLWSKLSYWAAIAAHFIVFRHPNKSRAILFILSFLSFWLIINWQISAIMMIILVVHEYGHIAALDLLGLPNKGFFPVPFLGGVTLYDSAITKSYSNHFIIALGGPLVGAIGAGLATIGYVVAHWNPLGVTAALMIAINLFNMVPTAMLDGGKMYDSIVSSFSPTWKKVSYSIMSAAVLASGLFLIKTSLVLAIVLMVFAVIHFFTRVRAGVKTIYEPMTSPIQIISCIAAYLVTILLMLAMMYPLVHVDFLMLIK